MIVGICKDKTYRCKLCNRYIGRKGFSRHSKFIHGLSIQDYLYKYELSQKGPICEVCGNNIIVNGFSYSTICSFKCSNNSPVRIAKIKETKKERYSNQNYNGREKAKMTCISKYGVSNPSKANCIKEKKKQTFLDRYGVLSPFQLPGVHSIIDKKFNLNGEGILSNPECLKKQQKTQIKKYGCLYAQLPAIRNKMKIQAFKTMQDPNNNFGVGALNSKLEDSFGESLLSEKIKFYRRKGIYRYQFDFYIPKLKLLVEMDGDYWHCKDWEPFAYHSQHKCYAIEKGIIDRRKSEYAEKRGFKVIRIGESDGYKNKIKIMEGIKNEYYYSESA